jgi:hypothetical protein
VYLASSFSERLRCLATNAPSPELLARIKVQFQVARGGSDAGNVRLAIAVEVFDYTIGRGYPAVV